MPDPAIFAVIGVVALIGLVYELLLADGASDPAGAEQESDDAGRAGDAETPTEQDAAARSTADGPTTPTRSSRALSVATAVFLPALGLGLFLLGLAVWLEPSVVPADLDGFLEAAARDQGPYVLLGLLVGGVAFLTVTAGSRPDAQSAVGDIDPPEPVARRAVPSPGATEKSLLDTLTSRDPEEVATAREATRDHLRTVAVESLVTYQGVSRREAATRVEAGTWTDRDDVAAFLGGDAAPDVGRWTALLDWLRAESTFQQRVRRSVAEIDALRGGSS